MFALGDDPQALLVDHIHADPGAGICGIVPEGALPSISWAMFASETSAMRRNCMWLSAIVF